MTERREQAAQDFRKAIRWIALLSVIMTGFGLWFLWMMGEWSLHGVIATILGLFLSTLLGAGLFSLAFFSDKSGHDDLATARPRQTAPPAQTPSE